MTSTADITSLNSVGEVRSQIRQAQAGGSVIYRDGDKDVAVLIPAPAFRAIQRILAIVWRETPATCWDDPLVGVSFAMSTNTHDLAVKK